ncbi:hypothetical protein H9V85_004438 [Salmonella enterica subsp. enterica serovar Louisiana]|uniref:Uncharacterized protein n=1 Tax=Salmonella enterica TaxID=28901 RepID=A0A743YFA3_SALER|nr:hypothetical protein [Salmonella enterica subsp. enterica serovar Louisiana]EEP8359191.1 hypothetical protein [Salmonella enterica subsp. enterica serovar Durham]EGZ3878101.1 hypothetical protein [Salmonella enterica subsp. enterica serovar Elokate]EHU5819453.1 hypothetical protein [Salmonella enterica]EHY8811830.1 hypothetical protein [Salmonella enterica subsp. enterica serovar Teshie]
MVPAVIDLVWPEIKRVERLLDNESPHQDIPVIFKSIIAVGWNSYLSQQYHNLRAPLVYQAFDFLVKPDSIVGKTMTYNIDDEPVNVTNKLASA